MTSEPAVDVKNLSVKFGDFTAVDNVTFSVNRGEIFGFLGANGAGKTTTIRVLCGLLRPSAGDVSVAGVNFDKGEMAIKSKVGYMSQRFTLYDDLTIEENLSFMASLRKLEEQTYRQRRDFILEFISLQLPLTSLVKNLPGGVKQQVSLAASILHDPEIVFLDEPTAGVTPAARARFWALIQELAKQHKTIFVTTHYMDEAEQCQRIALMRSGRIIALDTPANLKRQAFPQQLYELEPIKKISYADIAELKQHSAIEYFEPYGLRFHVAFRRSTDAEALQQTLHRDFEIRPIAATLEDVFIKRVEEQAT
ncbi:MAG: ABC transporter ATP-binding protein [Gammaproteobacteria bacterium]|nr:ABC transporter ATP-binding protein [Gammaproteobacteria bacterium]